MIKNYIDIGHNIKIQVIDSTFITKEVYNNIYSFFKKQNVAIIFLPSFCCYKFLEINYYLKLFKNFNCCVGVFNYDKWFRKSPPIVFNQWKLIKRSIIIQWLGCQLAINHISSFFVSDIHRYSQNPFKKLIGLRTNKKVFDLPFKLMEGRYNPNLDYDYPIFVIPGKIDKSRRDYLPILNFFSNLGLKKFKWKLILLGKPYKRYGRNIIRKADRINSSLGENRIIYLTDYVSKEIFDNYMNMATHIIAPIAKNAYKYGKDSGALYDIFKYNKLGIFNNSYFYNDSLIEKNVIITYKNIPHLYLILEDIINVSYSYKKIKKNFDEVSSYFKKDLYIDYVKKEIKDYLDTLTRDIIE